MLNDTKWQIPSICMGNCCCTTFLCYETWNISLHVDYYLSASYTDCTWMAAWYVNRQKILNIEESNVYTNILDNKIIWMSKLKEFCYYLHYMCT